MVQILNGNLKSNTAASYAPDVAQSRSVVGNWNFTDDTGAQAAYTIFTVTGDVVIMVSGLCQVALTSGGAATIEMGIAGNTAGLIAQTTATDLDQYEMWRDAVPEPSGSLANMTGAARQSAIFNGVDVILTVATADLTAGDIDFLCTWFPISADGNVVAA
jgi:hypothetical protein